MMRKIISFAICLLACIGAYAQDIIVKTDGTTVPAKVLNVTSTEVQYKKASNPNGPTYTVSVSELVSINYENGERDMFNSATTVPQTAASNYNPNILTNESATGFSDDSRLLATYYRDNKEIESPRHKAKVWKIAGIAGGAAIAAAGIYIMANADNYNIYSRIDYPTGFGAIITGVGVIGGTTCYLIGNHYSQKANKLANSIVSAPIMETDFDLNGCGNLRVGVDMLSYHQPNTRQINPGIGVGLRYTF